MILSIVGPTCLSFISGDTTTLWLIFLLVGEDAISDISYSERFLFKALVLKFVCLAIVYFIDPTKLGVFSCWAMRGGAVFVVFSFTVTSYPQADSKRTIKMVRKRRMDFFICKI